MYETDSYYLEHRIEETIYGMRYDTFLVDSGMLSEERMQPYRTAEEEERIKQGLIDVLKKKNRLPDVEEKSLSDENGKSFILKK